MAHVVARHTAISSSHMCTYHITARLASTYATFFSFIGLDAHTLSQSLVAVILDIDSQLILA